MKLAHADREKKGTNGAHGPMSGLFDVGHKINNMCRMLVPVPAYQRWRNVDYSTLVELTRKKSIISMNYV